MQTPAPTLQPAAASATPAATPAAPAEPTGPYHFAMLNELARNHPYLSAGLMSGLPMAALLAYYGANMHNPTNGPSGMGAALGELGLGGLGIANGMANKKYQQKYNAYKNQKPASPPTLGQAPATPVSAQQMYPNGIPNQTLPPMNGQP